MFSGNSFRQAFSQQLGAAPSATSYAAGVEETLDGLPRISRRIWTSMGCWRSRAKA